MKALNAYKIQHRKDGRYAVKVGNRGTVIQLYAKTKQQLKEKLADVLKQIEGRGSTSLKIKLARPHA